MRPQIIYQNEFKSSDEPLFGGGLDGVFGFSNGFGFSVGSNYLMSDAVDSYVLYSGNLLFDFINKGNIGSYVLAGTVVNYYNAPGTSGADTGTRVGCNVGAGFRFSVTKMSGLFVEAK